MTEHLTLVSPAAGVLACPACGFHPFDGARCSGCARSYPVLGGVPLLLPPQDVIDYRTALATRLGLRADALDDAFLASAAFGYRRQGLAEEFANLRGRFPDVFAAPADDAGPPVLQAVSRMLHPLFRRGEVTTRSIRLSNGPDLLASTGATPHHLSYRLYRGAKCIEADAPRSVLPVPLLPGRAMTIPMTFHAPARAGSYRVDIHLVQEHVAWSGVLASETIEVRDAPALEIPAGLTGGFDYAADFAASVEVLKTALARFSNPRVLELAGGMYPLSLTNPVEDHYVVDLCWPELQLAKLHHGGGVTFACADVDRLPLVPGSFDVIVICAALHHFPDPTETLRTVRPFLSPEGVMVIVREPCFVDVRAPGYVADLLQGFNEQVFLPEEYMAMFDAAGLATEHAQIDFSGSLKVILGQRDAAWSAPSRPSPSSRSPISLFAKYIFPKEKAPRE